MPNYRVALSFAQLSDPALSDFTNAVVLGLTSNPKFPTPPYAVGPLTDARQTYDDALAAMATGGSVQTALKNAARAALVAMLRKDASYVQTIAGTDLAGILSSGFGVNSTNSAPAPLLKPVVVDVDNFASTQLLLRLKTDRNARAFEVRHKNGTGDWENGGVYTQSRRIVVGNLTPGTNYELQARGVGGSMGYSDWSDPVSHMAT